MGGVIQIPQRFNVHAQPQYQCVLTQRFHAFSPKIALLPSSNVNALTGRPISFVGDATRKEGFFYFPGNDGYVDLGPDATIGGSNYSFVVVSRLDSFLNAFPVIFGAKNTIGANLMAFYSNSASYLDITIGQNSIGEQFPLTQFGSVAGTWHKLVFVNNGGTTKLFCNGVSVARTASNSLGASSGNSCLGQLNPGGLANDFNGSIAAFVLFNGILPDSVASELSANPWILFQAPPRRIWIVPSSGVSGSASCVNADDTSSASGTTTVTGSVAATNANDTSSASGTTTVTGTSSTTNADDSASASGSVGSAVSGSSSTTNADDTASASGTTTVVGSSSAVNTDDSSAATGTTTIVGSASITNANDSVSASGTVTSGSSGTVAYTNNDDVSAASGTTTVLGSAGQTNNNDTSSASGVINNGIVFETGFNPAATRRIKKPGVPNGTPDWLKTSLEIMQGRRGNAIPVPSQQTLTFSSTPTQAECQALYQYVNSVQSALADLINRFDT